MHSRARVGQLSQGQQRPGRRVSGANDGHALAGELGAEAAGDVGHAIEDPARRSRLDLAERR
jgi:hypothetical protein